MTATEALSPSSLALPSRAGLPAPRRVLIVGGGFGGLAVARALADAPVEITLIDRRNHHLFQPLLYQVATAALSPADIAWPLRTLFRGQQNIRITLGEVTKIDRAARCVLLSETAPIPYDRLILAPGARHAYFGHEDWEMHAPGLKTIPDALELRERMLMAFEQAQQAGDAQRASDYLTFVIVGGGPTGVELAGALMEIGRRAMAPDFPVLHRAEFRVILIEGGGRILEAFPPDLSGKAQMALEALGVTVMVNCRVHDVTGHGVLAGAQFIRTANVLWAAGNIASPILRSLDVPLDQTGRVRVERDLSLPGDPWTFVIGDAAHCESPEGRALPGVAPVAMQEGCYVAGLIAHDIRKEHRRFFRYRDRGMLATIGRAKAVARFGPVSSSGLVAWLAWSFIHIFFLIGFRNRFRVMVEWIWYYITFKPGARLIYGKPRGLREEGAGEANGLP